MSIQNVGQMCMFAALAIPLTIRFVKTLTLTLAIPLTIRFVKAGLSKRHVESTMRV